MDFGRTDALRRVKIAQRNLNHENTGPTTPSTNKLNAVGQGQSGSLARRGFSNSVKPMPLNAISPGLALSVRRREHNRLGRGGRDVIAAREAPANPPLSVIIAGLAGWIK